MYSKDVMVTKEKSLVQKVLLDIISRAIDFDVTISLEKEEVIANATSMYELLSLHPTRTGLIKVSANGEGEKEAVEAIAEIIEAAQR